MTRRGPQKGAPNAGRPHTSPEARARVLAHLEAGGRLSTAPEVHRDTARRIADEAGIVRVNGRPKKASVKVDNVETLETYSTVSKGPDNL